MALVRSELTIWSFDEKLTCVQISKSTSNKRPTPDYLVPLSGPAWDIKRDFPFIHWASNENKSYLRLFQSRKYLCNELDSATKQYLPGVCCEAEADYWEMASLELISRMETELGEPVDFNNVHSFLNQFTKLFRIGVCVYDLDRRGTRIGTYSPYDSPADWVKAERELRFIHIVYEQGHMHAISDLSEFNKSGKRVASLRDFHYCPVCDEKTTKELNTAKEAYVHITACSKKKQFGCGYSPEKTIMKSSRLSPVVKHFENLKKRKQPGQGSGAAAVTMKCQKCQEEMPNKLYFAQHRCEIKVPKAKIQEESKIWVFDIESSQAVIASGSYQHVCNCLCVKQVYGDEAHTFMNELDFLEWLLDSGYTEDSIWLAHNSGSYDMQFILRLLERKEIEYEYVPSPNSKHKMLSLSFMSFKFIDSIRFIPGSLASIAKAFDLEVTKGSFPHLFNSPENQFYEGPIPPLHGPIDYWGLNAFRSTKDKQTFLTWYEEQQILYCTCSSEETHSCDKQKWNMKTELVRYCELDVIVLANIIRMYRDECLNMDDDYNSEGVVQWKPPQIDPLCCMTLPQLTMKTLLLGFSEEKAPGYNFCRPMSYDAPIRGGSSYKAILWLRQLEWQQNIEIHGRWNRSREYYDWNIQANVDGYHVESDTVYLFLSCEYSGCQLCMQIHEQNRYIIPERGLSVDDANDSTRELVEWCQRRYKRCVVMWEHDFDEQSFPAYEIECAKLMDPQDAFYGGRTEVFSLYADITKFSDETIQYHDVTSLYPSVYAHHELPMGLPTFIHGPDTEIHRMHPDSLDAYFGYVRCYVIPSTFDHVGVLPFRDPDGRLTFPTYPMKGTWFTKELHIALSLGYVIREIYEVVHWPIGERSNQHLKGYVGYFLRMKQEAEGWRKLGASSDHPSEEEQLQVAGQLFVQNGHVGRIRPDRVAPNPIKRQLAKLYLNSLWGKFAQRPSDSNHVYLYGERQFFDFWYDTRIDHEHTSFRVMYPGVYQAYYKKRKEFCPPVGHANVFIAAAVTAGARTVLHKQLLRIHSLPLAGGQSRLLYCDTDSVIFIWPVGGEQLTSVGLGHWTDEYPDGGVVGFFALAPKIYSLQFQSGKQSSKAKGIQLTLDNQEKFKMEFIKPLLEQKAHGRVGPNTKISLANFNIYSNSNNMNHQYATMFSRYNRKDMQIIITKRKVVRDNEFEVGVSGLLSTVPLV
jgi:hypothetical protein